MPRGNQPPLRNALPGISDDEETVSRGGNIPLFKRGSIWYLVEVAIALLDVSRMVVFLEEKWDCHRRE